MPMMPIDLIHDIAPDTDDPILRAARANALDVLRRDADRGQADKMLASAPPQLGWRERVLSSRARAPSPPIQREP